MRKYFIYLLALFAITACSEYDEYGNDVGRSGKLEFGTNTDFLKLQDDSTHVAGMLEITANAPSVELKWNVSPSFNLDTTVTKLVLKNGRVQLPIKWTSKLSDGNYGPVTSAYSGGVLITSGDDSKYVPLIWADEVDSVKIMESLSVRTRAGEATPMATGKIEILSPNPLELDKDTCGIITFAYSGGGRAIVDYSDTEEITEFNTYHLNFDAIQPSYNGSPVLAQILWTDEGAPSVVEFLTHVKLTTTMGLVKFAYLSYIPPTPKEWEFIESIPDTLSNLPATGATVVGIANTNRQWSLKYRLNDGSEIVSSSAIKVDGEQSLLIRIPDNVSTTKRNILVDVWSQDTLKLSLKFTQLAAQGNFEIENIKPAVTEMLKATGDEVTVNVTTTKNWWISYGGQKFNFLETDSEGKVVIPANTGSTQRQVIITVGYDDTLVETYVYTQNFGDELQYDGSNVPSLIPVDGATYTFNFSGTYVGTLQVRGLLDDATTVIVTSPATAGKEVTMAIPNNYASLIKRTLKFQYKKGAEEWKDLEMPVGTVEKAEQEKAEIVPQVLPTTDIPREGGTTSGVFSGTYRGNVKMKAVSGAVTVEETGVCPGTVNIVIPSITGFSDRIFEFFYSTDNGTTWTAMSTRTQVAGTLIVGSITPDDKKIPAKGGGYSCSFSGTYPGTIQFRAKSGTTVFDTQSGTAPVTMSVQVPANEDKNERDVVFEYSKDGGTTWIEITTKPQTSDIEIGGGDNNTGDWEDKGEINGGGEV